MGPRRYGYWNSPMKFPPMRDCIFIDIETDIDTNQIWLIGLKDKDGLTQIIADHYYQERQILLEFGNYLRRRSGCPLICYSTTNFDFRIIWNRLSQMNLTEVQETVKDRALIDLGTLLRRHFKPFGSSYSLKTLRYIIRYEYELEEMRGDELAIRYYRQIRKFGSITPSFKEIALSYNRDDVEILEFMLNLFEDHIQFDQTYVHNYDQKKLADTIVPKVYSSKWADNYIRISVANHDADYIQAFLMRWGCPLPERREGVNITALYWRSKFARELLEQILKNAEFSDLLD